MSRVDASCSTNYSDASQLYTPFSDEVLQSVECPEVPIETFSPPPRRAADVPAAVRKPDHPVLEANMGAAGFATLIEPAAAALLDAGFEAGAYVLGGLANAIPPVVFALVLLKPSPAGDGSAPDSPDAPGSGKPDGPKGPDIGPAVVGYALSRDLGNDHTLTPRDFEGAGAPGNVEVHPRDINGQLLPQRGFLPPPNHQPGFVPLWQPQKEEDPNRSVASGGGGAEPDATDDPPHASSSESNSGDPAAAGETPASDADKDSQAKPPQDHSKPGREYEALRLSLPGRYDTTLTAVGSQRNHALAGVESAALSLQDAQGVAILVGSNNVLGQPNSDGFTGAAELGLALQKAGKSAMYVVHDQQGAQTMRKILADLGRPVSRGQNEVVVFDSPYGTEAKQQATGLLDEFGIDHVVAVDVPSRNRNGVYLDPRGFPIQDENAPLDEIVRLANQRPGLTTIGIGSDGNEAGMAGVFPSDSRNAVIATKYSITGWNASLGAQALGIEVHRLNQTPAKGQPTDWQRETSLATLLSSGAVDEVTQSSDSKDRSIVGNTGIKGHGPEVHAAMAKLLQAQAGKDPGQIGYRFEAGSYRTVAAFDSSNGGIFAAGNLAAALQTSNVGPVRFVVVVDHGNAPYGTRWDPETELPGIVNNALTAIEGIGPPSGLGVGDVQVIAMACNTACTPTRVLYAKGVEVPVIDLIDTTVGEILERGGAHPVSISTPATAEMHSYGDRVSSARADQLKQAGGVPVTERTQIPGDHVYAWTTTVSNGESSNGSTSLQPTKITEIGSRKWAPIVNKLQHESTDPATRAVVDREINDIIDQIPPDATSIWLTCTHYPALKPLIEAALEKRDMAIEVIDPMLAQAEIMVGELGPQSPDTPTRADGSIRPPKVIMTSGSENDNVPGSARSLSGRNDAIVFHVPSFDPQSPGLKDVQGYIHNALSPDGSPYDPLLVAFNSRSIAKLHDNGRVEAAAMATKNVNKVMILTNFNVAEGMPETDGPPGAAALGHAYETVGKDVMYVVSDESAKGVLRAALKPYGVIHAQIEVFSAGTPAEGRVVAEDMLDAFAPDAVVAVEVPGKTAKTGPVNMRGVPIEGFNSPLYQLTLEANKRKGMLTIGIFDGGNEVGAGNVSDRVPLALDKKTDMASAVPVDYHVAAWNSNFGADTLAIEVLRQHGMLEWAHTSNQLVSSIEETMHAGAVDGVTRGAVPGEAIDGGESGVDGFSPWVHGVMHDMQMRVAHERPEPAALLPTGQQPIRPSSPKFDPSK